MMNHEKQKKQEKLCQRITYFLYFVILALVMFKGPLTAPDTGTYLSFSPHRPPVYPLFLNFFVFFLGDVKYAFAVIFAQTFLGICSIEYLLRNLKDKVGLSSFAGLVSAVLLLSPYLFNEGNFILSEGLAYPLFLLLVGTVIVFLREKNFIIFFYLLLISVLLILTRPQFFFIVVFLFLLSCYMLWLVHAKAIKYFLSLALAVLSLQGIDLGYQYILTGKFDRIPFVGLQFVIPHLYILTPDRLEQIQEPEQKKFLTLALEARQEFIHRKFCGKHDRNSSEFSDLINAEASASEYPWEYNSYISEVLGKAINNMPELKNQHEQDHFLMSVSLSLLKVDFIPWLKLYLKQMYKHTGVMLFVLSVGLIYFGMYLYKNVKLKYSQQNQQRIFISEILISFICLYFGNLKFVLLFEPLLPRYTFYTDCLAVICILILIEMVFAPFSHLYKGSK